MLEINKIDVFYGKYHALRDISLKIDEGELVVLIGSNGSGKTTLIKSICGTAPPASGEILFKGERMDNLPPNVIVERGISCVPEGRRIFSHMTVRENLMMGSYIAGKKNRNENIKKMCNMFPILDERKNQLGGTLSGGEQQMLAIARGLMSEPTLLLLDEPTLGLAPVIVQQLPEIINEIHNAGISVILVEQNARFGLKLASRGYVLETGSIILKGRTQELVNNDFVKKTYLGI